MATKTKGIDTAIILAAGRGSRLNNSGRPKPLTPFLGVPLIERSIRGLYACGIKKFYIITGYKSDEVENFLKTLEQKLDQVTITCIFNKHWEAGNGTSFLAATQANLKNNFVLSMCDHIFEKELIELVVRATPPKRGMMLLVDKRIKNAVIDQNDATKVIIQEGLIKKIGKNLEVYSGYDTGLFVCSKEVFEELKELSPHTPLSLSDIVGFLANTGKARAIETTKGFWADLDDKGAFKRAERALLLLLRGKGHDGPVSRLLNRPISIRLSSILVNTPITPNQITLISFSMALAAAFFLTKDSYLWFATGAILAQLASIIDGCDGEIARLKWLQSDYGAWLDAVLDRYADAFLISAITWHVANYHSLGNLGWGIGILALIGSLINSYTADKYDGWMKKHNKTQRFRMGRDVRIFLVFLSGISYRPVELLIMLAGIMNTENIRRMWQLRTA
ncbi:CTP:Inositol-1-phosphate cytidylyltransferase [Dissulfuribacter thermophilus]|uniref:Bifunctional IPC transferase and DIPP synthase n=1 Tax=Dissulfuribacter thermophilus TaxID=1156395 RepID=A0A1B9F2I0_9BACT|nr:NTP transferase domain-containing protein [Dissulfuribacter thermophilus]OCC14136.1 CTP:Inositol-1-phosphate cytidylyltransferase [Dissulfuribacter thermophilus]